MRSLILFGSKYGTSETCAKKLKGYMHGEVDLVNVKNSADILLDNYDKVIIGSSVYMGIINKEIKKFIKDNQSELMSKKLGLFICCMSEGEKINEQFAQNLSKEILDSAMIKENFGGEFKFSKMNFFERKIIKMIAKKGPSLEVVDGKTDINKINEDAISRFANKIG